jgi:carbamoyltransferase
MIFRHDPEIGHLFVPNLTARLPGESGWHFLRTNSLGFRADAEPEEPRGGRPRILMLGDSITAGDGCANEERFSDLLAGALDAEVINLGLSGSGTDQQLLIFEGFGRALAADLIVWMLPAENILRNKVSARVAIDRFGRQVMAPKPWFVLAEEGLELRGVPVPRERPLVEEAADHPLIQDWMQARGPRPARARRRPSGLELLDLYRRHPAFAPLRYLIRRRVPGVRSAILRRSGFQPYTDYLSPESAGWRLMEALVRRLLAAAAPTPVLLVPIPSYFHFYDGIAPIYQELFAGLADPGRQVHVMDLTAPLAALPRAERRSLVFPRDKTHFTPFGHQVVAGLLAREIGARGLPGGRPAPAPPRVRRSRPKPAGTWVLGLSGFFHNSAAALIRDGEIVAAAEEERFTRVKNDRGFPALAANYCLEEGGLQAGDLAAVVFYENVALTFERLLCSLAAAAPESEEVWTAALPSWLGRKVSLPALLREHLGYAGPLLQDRHHRAHAASAFFPSPFGRAAVLTVDGVGEWATASIGAGRGNGLEMLQEMRFPHSLGLLYSAFTQFLGFRVNFDEYKVMGLAPYGEPRYVDTILDRVAALREDGSLALDLSRFSFLGRPSMVGEPFAELFGPPRAPGGPITERDVDLARSIQEVTERAFLRMAGHAHRLTGERRLCLAGGVALNCVANGRLLREGPFEEIWIQPAAGDAGGALGAALDAYHTHFGGLRPAAREGAALQGSSCWGPGFTENEIAAFLDTHGLPHRPLAADERPATVARLLAGQGVVGHFAGRVELGPRALGSRSILADPRDPLLPKVLNQRIKGRESFRPFAPAVLLERAHEYFELEGESPYMLLVARVKGLRPGRLPRRPVGDLVALLCEPRSDIPAVTHVDGTARVQTVDGAGPRELRGVLQAFAAETGCAVLVNTSFNGRDEPIVCTPYDAYRCFMRSGLEHLLLGDHLLVKSEQPEWREPPPAPAGAPAAVPEELARRLRRLYHSDLLPLARRLRARGVLGLGAAGWTDWPAAGRAAVCEIPAGLSSGRPDEVADALLGQWQEAGSAPAFAGLVRKLMRLARRFPSREPWAEEVPDTVYALF